MYSVKIFISHLTKKSIKKNRGIKCKSLIHNRIKIMVFFCVEHLHSFKLLSTIVKLYRALNHHVNRKGKTTENARPLFRRSHVACRIDGNIVVDRRRRRRASPIRVLLSPPTTWRTDSDHGKMISPPSAVRFSRPVRNGQRTIRKRGRASHHGDTSFFTLRPRRARIRSAAPSPSS